MNQTLSFLFMCLSFLIIPVNAFAIPGFDFVITGSVSTGYDDNVTLTNENEKSDTVTKLSAGIGAEQKGRTYDLNIAGSFTQHLYASNPSFNNNSQDVNIALNKEISPYDRFSASNRFVHAEDVSSFEDAFGRTSGRYSYYRNILDMEYTKDLSKYVAVRGRYGNETFNASRKDVRDSLLHRVGFDIDFIKSSATAFLLGYDFSTRHMDEIGRAFVQTLAIGFKHFLTKSFHVDARAGVSFVENFNGTDTSEPNVVVALINDFNETDSAGLSYRKTSMPNSSTADIFDSWRVALNVNRQLLERLKMAVSVFFGKGDFKALDIRDAQSGVSARFEYAVKQDVTAFLAYTYAEVDSSLDSRDYARNLVEVGVRISF